jgi:hypothetical protein
MSDWVSHVKKVSSEKGISYKEAMSVAKSTYSKPAKAKATKEPKVKEAGEAKMPRKKKEKEYKQEMPDMVSKAENRQKLVVKHDKETRVKSAEAKEKKKKEPLMK